MRPHARPPWWPDDEPWPPTDRMRGWGGSWGGRRGWGWGPRRYGRGGMARRFGCFLVVLATLFVSVGLLVLWLLAGLLGFASAEGPLADLARPAGLVVLVLGLVALIVAIRFVRNVAPPLAELVDAAGRVEAGDYTVRVSEGSRDSRELRGLGRAFNEMAARLETEDADRRRLLADVSHELRTPLAVIQGNLEALIDGVYPADEAHLAPLLDETRVLERLIEDLRTLSLAEAGALPLHREPTDLGALLEDVAAGFRNQAEAKGIALQVEVAMGLPAADVDPVRLRQVVSNLVDNALRYVPGGGAIRLAVRHDDAPAGFQLEVTDDGPGIAPELLPHVFDRFTKSAGSRGSGLGLAIARAVVTAHGGTIIAEAGTDGRGTTIRISLPAA